MILAPDRQLICPRCRKPFARPSQRRQWLRRTRNDPRDRFRPGLLNMAAGDELLDSVGQELLRASDATGAIDNGTDNSCCCGSGSGTGICCEQVLATFSGFDGTGVMSNTMTATGSLDGLSVCVPLVCAGSGSCVDFWGSCCTYFLNTPCGLTVTDFRGSRVRVLIFLSLCFGSGWSFQVTATFAPFGFGTSEDEILFDNTGVIFDPGPSPNYPADPSTPDDCTTRTISVAARTSLAGSSSIVTVIDSGTITLAPGAC